jgi:hypothetical protein
LNRWTAHVEWLLDIQLTAEQRHECQRLWVQRWQETDQAHRDRFWTGANVALAWQKEVAAKSAAERNDLCALPRARLLARLRTSSDPDERLLLAAYESAHKPGGVRNPILVAGAAPLTQAVVDQSRRFIEWALDIRLSQQQRWEYQARMVRDWEYLDQAAREATVKNSGEELVGKLSRLTAEQRNQLRAELRPGILSRLQQQSGDELSPWLLAVYQAAKRP